jgi:hypothetical protein
MCAIYGTIDPTVKRADDGAVIGSIEGSNECSFFDAIESAVGTANEAADGRTVITAIEKSVVAAVRSAIEHSIEAAVERANEHTIVPALE